jgi:hypothetical protein
MDPVLFEIQRDHPDHSDLELATVTLPPPSPPLHPQPTQQWIDVWLFVSMCCIFASIITIIVGLIVKAITGKSMEVIIYIVCGIYGFMLLFLVAYWCVFQCRNRCCAFKCQTRTV